MTHEQKPESAEFRTRKAQRDILAYDYMKAGMGRNMAFAVAERHILEAEARGVAEVNAYQSRVDDWMAACFGAEISADRMERNHRFLEEAIELVQATECTQSEAHQLVDYVYGRPVGDPAQEVGGVMVTLAALCSAHVITLKDAAETELARVWTKVEKIRAKQAAKPKNSPLPEHVAEQRRKDAEGIEVAGYIPADTPNFFAISEAKYASTAMHRKPFPNDVPVYYCPANVAALEARVRELEGEVRSIRERVKEAASSVMGIKTAAMGGDNLAILLCTYFEGLIGKTDPNGWLQEATEACDEIQSAIVAHMVAAIREGGEHGELA